MKHTRKRYQQGSLTLEKQKTGPSVWVYRWRESNHIGETVQRKRIVGPKTEYPTKSAALKAVDGLRLEVNAEVSSLTPMTVDQIIEHYKQTELADANRKTTRTKQVYVHQLENVISPKWRSHLLKDVKAIAVENWLNQMHVAPGTRYKTKGVMSILFQHAIRYEWALANPIRGVRQSALPLQEEIGLEPVEIVALLAELRDPFRTLVLLASVTGLRRGELFGLKWEEVDFNATEVRVVRSIGDQIEGLPKTLASSRPLPMSSELAASLENWRKQTAFPALRIGCSPVPSPLARNRTGRMLC